MRQLYHPNKNLVLARKLSRMLLMVLVEVVVRVLLELCPQCPQCPANSQTLSSSLCPRLLNMGRLTGKTQYDFPKLSQQLNVQIGADCYQ